MYNHYLSGILGRAPDDLDMSSVTAFKANYHHKTAINIVTNIAHGALRVEACGMYDVPMVGDRLEHAKRLVREGMEQGAVGLATGMSYHPQAWSDTEELIELCKIVAEFDGVYTTHLRDVNPDRGFGGGGVPEALEIGRRSGVKVHFSHTRTAVNNGRKGGGAHGAVRRSQGRGRSDAGTLPVPDRKLIHAQQHAVAGSQRRPGRDHRAAPGR